MDSSATKGTSVREPLNPGNYPNLRTAINDDEGRRSEAGDKYRESSMVEKPAKPANTSLPVFDDKIDTTE